MCTIALLGNETFSTRHHVTIINQLNDLNLTRYYVIYTILEIIQNFTNPYWHFLSASIHEVNCSYICTSLINGEKIKYHI